MGTAAGVGHSVYRNPAEAGKEAALSALRQAGIEKADFLFVFATVGYDQQALINSIRETTSGAVKRLLRRRCNNTARDRGDRLWGISDGHPLRRTPV